MSFHAVFENRGAGLRVGDDIVEAASGSICDGECVLQGRGENRSEAGGCEDTFCRSILEGDAIFKDIKEVNGGSVGGAKAERT